MPLKFVFKLAALWVSFHHPILTGKQTRDILRFPPHTTDGLWWQLRGTKGRRGLGRTVRPGQRDSGRPHPDGVAETETFQSRRRGGRRCWWHAHCHSLAGAMPTKATMYRHATRSGRRRAVSQSWTRGKRCVHKTDHFGTVRTAEDRKPPRRPSTGD